MNSPTDTMSPLRPQNFFLAVSSSLARLYPVPTGSMKQMSANFNQVEGFSTSL